jgi:hypothetical protein
VAATAAVFGEHLPGAGELYASAARTATPTAREFGPPEGAVGLTIRIDVSASAATPSVVFTIQARDEVAGEWFDILASAAITGAGSTVMRVDPRIVASANVVAQSALFPRMRLTPVHADADSITYSVAAFASA